MASSRPAPVLAMVSGGADSMCLLHMLLAVHDGEVGVLTIDHGLRREAADEVAMVAAAAEALGCRVHRAALALPPGAGVQERARSARIELAERIAAGHGYERIATGHTASDQAETVLFRIARGAGRSGALGIAARRGRFIRPLLCVTGTETRRWCRDAGVTVVRDPSNRDPAYTRVRVRREFLPALERVHPSAAAHVASFADLLRDEDEVLTTVVEAAWTRTSHPAGGVDVVALRQSTRRCGACSCGGSSALRACTAARWSGSTWRGAWRSPPPAAG